MTGALFVASTVLDPRVCYGRAPWAVGGYGLYLVVLMLAFMIEGPYYPGGLFVREVLETVLRLSLWVLLFWACSNLLRNERVFRSVLLALILGCMVRAALPLFGLVRSTSMKGVERVAALGQNPNQSALVLVMGLLALIGLAYVLPQGDRRLRRLAPWGIALLGIGLVQTGSRGGLLTLTVGVLLFLSSGQNLRMRARNFAVGLVLLAGMSVLVLRSESMLARIEKTAATGHMSGRDVIWPTLLTMVREKPLLGWGPVTYKRELGARLNDPEHGQRDAHNLMLDVVTSSGLAGVIPFLFATWLCLRGAWRARAGPRGIVPLALVSAILVSNMTQNRLTWPVLWLILAVGIASEWAGATAPETGPGRPDLMPGPAPRRARSAPAPV
jgi:O-antigen ligase